MLLRLHSYGMAIRGDSCRLVVVRAFNSLRVRHLPTNGHSFAGQIRKEDCSFASFH